MICTSYLISGQRVKSVLMMLKMAWVVFSVIFSSGLCWIVRLWISVADRPSYSTFSKDSLQGEKYWERSNCLSEFSRTEILQFKNKELLINITIIIFQHTVSRAREVIIIFGIVCNVGEQRTLTICTPEPPHFTI